VDIPSVRRSWVDLKNWVLNMWNMQLRPFVELFEVTLKELHLSRYERHIHEKQFIGSIGWRDMLMPPYRRYTLSLGFVRSMTETLIRSAVGTKVSPWLEISLTQIDRLLSFVERIKSLKSVPGTEVAATNVVNYRRLQVGHYFLPILKSI
jgi:hypothetical protein